MLSKKIEKGINEQIQSEFYSSHFYLSMAAYCEEIDLSGFAHWMRVQSEEEREHAMKFFDYLNERGGRVFLEAIDKPPSSFKSPRDIFEQTLKHEQQVTKMIHRLYKTAKDENDYATEVELQWFIREQVEEEKGASDILEKLKMVQNAPGALLMIDRQLGSRERNP